MERVCQLSWSVRPDARQKGRYHESVVYEHEIIHSATQGTMLYITAHLTTGMTLL